MANKIDGNLVGLYISTVLTSPSPTDWKEVICGDNIGVDGSADVTARRTKCGVLKSVGPAAWQITGSLVADHTPATGKISADDLVGLFQNQTNVLVKAEYVNGGSTLYLRQGQGQFSKYTEKSSSSDMVEADFTIDVSGNITI